MDGVAARPPMVVINRKLCITLTFTLFISEKGRA